MAKLWYIKERNNPQFDKPYYVAEGQLSKRDAMKKEDCLYGYNIMISFETENGYRDRLNRLKNEGFNIFT